MTFEKLSLALYMAHFDGKKKIASKDMLLFFG